MCKLGKVLIISWIQTYIVRTTRSCNVRTWTKTYFLRTTRGIHKFMKHKDMDSAQLFEDSEGIHVDDLYQS